MTTLDLNSDARMLVHAGQIENEFPYRRATMTGHNNEPTYRVIGVRKDGERVIISSHSTEVVANRVLALLMGGDFEDIRVEESPPKKP